MTARDHWFLHACPAYERFLKVSTRENAIECAKAIEDVRGWYWQDKHPGIDPKNERQSYAAFNRELFASCPVLQLIKDIAELAKHGGHLGRSGVQVKEIRGAGVGGTVWVSSPPMGESGPFRNVHESEPECTLHAVLYDGLDEPLPPMLARAMEYWRDALL
jgi:hypothetical protein